MNPLESFMMQLQPGEQDQKQAPRPLPEAQLMELYDRWDRYNQPAALTPGMAVREKRGMGMLRLEYRPTHVMMLWRMLDLSTKHDEVLAAKWIRQFETNRVDCVIAYMNDDGGVLNFELRELAQLEPWTHDEGQPA